MRYYFLQYVVSPMPELVVEEPSFTKIDRGDRFV